MLFTTTIEYIKITCLSIDLFKSIHNLKSQLKVGGHCLKLQFFYF